jgi:CBS domain-containing protein
MSDQFSLANILQKNVVQISSSASVFEATEIMRDQKIGALLVHKGNKICGVFSERDLAFRVIPEELPIYETPLHKVMTTDLVTTPVDTKPTVAMELMLKHHIRHLPITDLSGEIIGVVGFRDVMKFVVRGLVALNKQMADELNQFRFLHL